MWNFSFVCLRHQPTISSRALMAFIGWSRLPDSNRTANSALKKHVAITTNMMKYDSESHAKPNEHNREINTREINDFFKIKDESIKIRRKGKAKGKGKKK